MKNIKVFENISDNSKKRLKNLKKEISIQKKEILFHEREIVENVYFIKSGKVSIFKTSENGERKVIFILRDGDMINEVLINGKNTPFCCEAFEKTVLFEFRSIDLLDIMKDDFELTKNILENHQYINRRLFRQLKNTIYIRMDKKLAAKLYKLAKEFGIKNNEWTLIGTDLTITYIADMIGCKRETLSRAMKILQDKNLVRIENKKIYVEMKELSNYFKEC